MRYTLITKNGSIMRFYVLACAKCYQGIYGGVVFDEEVLAVELLNID